MSDLIHRLPDDPYERDEVLLREVVAGRAHFEWAPVEIGDFKVWVSRDFLRFGACHGPRLGTTAYTAQQIADALDAILPTPAIADAIARTAYEQGGLVPPHPQTINHRTDGYLQHSRDIDNDLPAGHTGIVDGAKVWAISLDVWSKRGFATNYGWHMHIAGHLMHPNRPSETVAELFVIQGPHEAHHTGKDVDGDGYADGGHADYSQLLRVVRREAEYLGKKVDLADALTGKLGAEAAAQLNHERRALPGFRLPGVPVIEWVIGEAEPLEVAAHEDADGAPRVTQLGERGPDVVAWQRYLMANGHDLPRFGADGDHGGETEAATKAWLATQRREDDDIYPDTEPPPSSLVLLEDLVPPIEFRQARHYGRGRPRGGVLGITIHTAEISEHPEGAEALQHVAATNTRQASWHYAVDNDTITASVHVSDRSFAAGPGNDRDIHIELSGRAGQGEAGWADAYSRAVLENVAALCGKLCADNGIPVRKIDAFGTLSQLPGIRGHIEWSSASTMARRRGLKENPWWNPARGRWRSTNHHDPGKHFPWQQFLARVRQHVAARAA